MSNLLNLKIIFFIFVIILDYEYKSMTSANQNHIKSIQADVRNCKAPKHEKVSNVKVENLKICVIDSQHHKLLYHFYECCRFLK